MDRISDLPQSIIETILCLLPYQDVVRTSILSKEWRYYWTKIPKIVVIVDTCQATPLKRKRKQEQKQKMIKKSKLLFDICQTLSMHEGPIHEFYLSLKNEWDNVGEIDSIIYLLSRKNTVKKMILDCDRRWLFKSLPVSLLSMSQLRYLYVTGWYLSYEPTSSQPKHGTSESSKKKEKEKKTSSGVGNLTSLYVHHSCFSMTTLLRLLTKCPLLKTLALTDNHTDALFRPEATISNLIPRLPVIENLTLCCRIIKSLSLGNLPKEVPIALVHLKHFCIEDIYFGRYHALRIISLFIKSSPNLEKLTFKIKDKESRGKIVTFSSILEDYTNIWMEHLSELEITYISSEQTELNIVKLILMRSPVLKKLRIHISKSYKDAEMQISDTLLSAPHASPGLELIVEKEPF